jgi:2,3-bisphosphoglycerate-independent phosphoglycerate mutase
MGNKAILIITDGIGHNSSDLYNAFTNANTPTYDHLFSSYPYSMIKTSGLSVGLPAGQMGNSEVGHMTLGSGRIIYQDLVKINKAIEEDSLKDNDILKETINASNSIHLAGLVSDGGVHSHISHIKAMAQIAAEKNKKVYLHIITDGRDVAPDSAKRYVKELMEICNDSIKIATIAGRYYTMDRDKRWERVQKGYDVIANGSMSSQNNSDDILAYIDSQYAKDVYDEFIEPCTIAQYEGLKENDGVVFCNFRSDRFREISQAVADKTFNEFDTKKIELNIATMTMYNENFPLPIMFPKISPNNTLAQVLSQKGLTQLHTAETEKYAHVTFFFNGGIEEEYPGETRVLVPSPKVATYDLQPEMSAPQVGQEVCNAINNSHDFIVVNFANGDMVGHTGVYEAGIKAVEAVDKEIGTIIELAKEKSYDVLITSDHGNCEMMKDNEGNTLTNHTTEDVYCFLISEKYKALKDGGLNNIAPTVLKLMDVEIPDEMDEPLI